MDPRLQLKHFRRAYLAVLHPDRGHGADRAPRRELLRLELAPLPPAGAPADVPVRGAWTAPKCAGAAPAPRVGHTFVADREGRRLWALGGMA